MENDNKYNNYQEHSVPIYPINNTIIIDNIVYIEIDENKIII